MEAGTQLDHPGLSSNKHYWYSQLAGWSIYIVFEFSLMLALSGRKANVPVMAENVLLAAVYGAITTHLLHLYLRGRRWLQLPARRLMPRLIGIVVSLAAGVAELETLTNCFLTHVTLHQLIDPRTFCVRWIMQMVVFVAWITLYVALHELRWRREAEGRALRLEVVAQQALLRGLRAQLHPHFFFNCLNDLRELIAEDPERAQQMVTQLAGLMRYSLRTNHSEVVLLADELSAVKDYLALEVVRFEERLRVHWDIAAEVQNVRIPPMLLQTLVENALKHGIARRPQGGEVRIAIRADDYQMELEVLNNGEVREELSGNGIGLRNAQERLNLIYGEQAKVALENAGRGWVRAKVTLPINPIRVGTQ